MGKNSNPVLEIFMDVLSKQRNKSYEEVKFEYISQPSPTESASTDLKRLEVQQTIAEIVILTKRRTKNLKNQEITNNAA